MVDISLTTMNFTFFRYRFALPIKTAVLGLPIGQHISLVADMEGKAVSRSYTPTSHHDTQGHFDLLIKVNIKLTNISLKSQSFEN